MQCYLEINTGICDDVAEVERDLTAKIQAVDEAAARRRACGSSGAATHPFSRWQDQEVTPNERYLGLVDLLQETARRLVTFGLHVHVGARLGRQGDHDLRPDPARTCRRSWPSRSTARSGTAATPGCTRSGAR